MRRLSGPGRPIANSGGQFRQLIRGVTALSLLMSVFVLSHAAIADDDLPQAPQAPIPIGWIGPLTGSASVLGVDSVQIAKDIITEVNAEGGINGRTLRLAVEDDQNITTKTVSAFHRLIEIEKVKAIVVLSYGGLMAIAKEAQEKGILLIDPLDCDNRIAALPQNIFCIAKRTEDAGYAVADIASARRADPTAIIYFDYEPFMMYVANATKAQLETSGMNVPFFESPSAQSTDFRPLLLRAKSRGVKSLFLFGDDRIGLAVRQADEVGLNAQIYGLASFNTPGFRKMAGDAIEGIIIAGWFAPRTKAYEDFLAGFKQKYGREPHLEVGTIPTYDVMRIMVDALRASMKNGNYEFDVPKVRSYLYGVKNYQGLSGNISIEADGSVQNLPVKAFEIKDGRFEPLK